MDRNIFGRMRNVGGLFRGKFVSTEEQVAIFLSILAHHKKIGWSNISFVDLAKLFHTMSI